MRLGARLGLALRTPEKGEDPVDLLGVLVSVARMVPEEGGLIGWISLLVFFYYRMMYFTTPLQDLLWVVWKATISVTR